MVLACVRLYVRLSIFFTTIAYFCSYREGIACSMDVFLVNTNCKYTE